MLVREKTKREVEIEDIMRQLKQLDDDKSSLKHLKAMELQTLKSQHEQSLHESISHSKQLQADIDLLQEQISKS